MTGVRIGIGFFLVSVIVSCGGSTMTTPTTPTTTTASTTPSTATVTIPANARNLGSAAYVPNPVTISVGGKVTWSNTDSTTHDVVADGGTFDSGRMGQNGTFDTTFQTKGTFTYHCSIHPSMVGTVTVQ